MKSFHHSLSKTAVAAAATLLGLSIGSPALAQSGVSISGYLDMGVYRDTADRWNVGTIQRSNIAFSGVEDLGDGLAATFKLNHRLDLDTGTPEGVGAKPFWHGEATVGLKGAFGSLKVGRALDAMNNNDWQFDPWGNFNRVASPAWDMWHYNFPSDPTGNGGGAEYGRLNNGVFYDSPTINGFALHLSGSPERKPGDANRALGGALTYHLDSLAAMVAHEKNSAGATDTFLGLRGDVKGVSLMGAYDISKSGASKAKTLTLGVQYVLNQYTFSGGWGKVDLDGVKVQQTLSGGVRYALSKRTSVYADVARKRFVANSKSVYGAGISHSF